MEIKIEFSDVKDLRVKLTAFLEDLEPNNRQPCNDLLSILYPDNQTLQEACPDIQTHQIVPAFDLVPVQELTTTGTGLLEPIADPVDHAVVEVPTQVEEVKPKATRKKKEPTFVIPQPAPVVEPVTVAAPVVSQLGVEPKNFFSSSEFSRSFPKVMSALLANQTIDHTYLANKCKEFGVTFIYALSNDTKKLSELYNQMVLEGIISQKGEY